MQWSGFVEGIFCCNLTSAYGGGGVESGNWKHYERLTRDLDELS
jgi:hypothetical protein